MRSREIVLAAAVAAAAGAAVPGAGEDEGLRPYVQPFREGRIDWGAGVASARGSVPQPAQPGGRALVEAGRAAEMRARAALLAMVQRARVDSDIRVGDRPDVVEKVSGILRGAKVVREGPVEGGLYEVEVEAPLNGVEGISYAVYEVAYPPARRPSGPREPAALPPSAAAPGGEPAEGEAAVTGIVIDARGSGLQPALLPRIVDASGEVVSSPETVSEEALRERGMAAYATGTEPSSWWRDRVGENPIVILASAPEQPPAASRPAGPAGQDPNAGPLPARRGPRPYRVKAAAAGGALKADVVLGKADADRLEAAPGAAAALRDCRVLVIVESPVGGVEGVRRPPSENPPGVRALLQRAWPARG